MPEEVAAEGVVTEGAPSGEVVDAEPFVTDELGEPTGGETGEAVTGASEEPELFTVKIGGREEKVSLEEALNGYQRQADYTRKSQELAQQREQVAQMHALQSALERDPRTTLVALAGVFGVDLGGAQGNAVASVDANADPLEILAREVESLRGTLTAQQQAASAAQQQAQQQVAVHAQIDREITELKSLHGDFDAQELARYAVENQINAPLSVVYRAWQFDRAEQARIAENNRIVAAKRRGQVVSGGQSTGGAGTVVSGNGGGRMTAREAILAALSSAQ